MAANIDSSWLRPIFDAFLNVSRRFDFLRIGPLCNGSRSRNFRDAYCDLRQLKESNSSIIGFTLSLSVHMNELFNRAYDIVKAQKSEETIALSTEETQALVYLKKFMNEIEMHTRNMMNAYEKMKIDSSTETVLSTALAQHVLTPLSSGYTCSIDVKAHGKGQTKTCKCDFNKPNIQFGATGIGHHKVWHGFVDIVMKERTDRTETVCAAKVVTKPTISDDIGTIEDTESMDTPDVEGDDKPNSAKRTKYYDDQTVNLHSVSGDSSSDTELKRNKHLEDQAVAQAIVFALAVKQQYPNTKRFVPSILFCDTKFYIIMYEPVKDILVVSGEYLIWDQIPPTSLNPASIIVLWMVIYNKLFCEGGDIFENPSEIKAGFFDQVRENKEWYEHLLLNTSSFETETEEPGFTATKRRDSDLFKYVNLKRQRANNVN